MKALAAISVILTLGQAGAAVAQSVLAHMPGAVDTRDIILGISPTVSGAQSGISDMS